MLLLTPWTFMASSRLKFASARIFTHYSTVPFIIHFIILIPNHEFISCDGVFYPVCPMLYSMVDAQLFLQPQPAPHSGHILSHRTYVLTYSLVQIPSWEANWFAASQEIPRISRNPKVHYRTHKRPPPLSILGQPNPIHILTSHLLEIRSNIIHPSTSRSPQCSLSLRFPHQDILSHLHLKMFPLRVPTSQRTYNLVTIVAMENRV